MFGYYYYNSESCSKSLNYDNKYNEQSNGVKVKITSLNNTVSTLSFTGSE